MVIDEQIECSYGLLSVYYSERTDPNTCPGTITVEQPNQQNNLLYETIYITKEPLSELIKVLQKALKEM